MERTINFASKYIVPFGRTSIKDSSLLLSWAGSGFCFKFIGTELRIKFGTFDSDRHFYFKITIDKISQTHCVCAADQVIVIRELKNGHHDVKVTKITESISLAEIKEITIRGTEVSLLQDVALPSLKFEFIGDSLTSGFGNMSEPDADIYRASEQDITYAYSYLTASALKADARFICCSGKGIFNNWDGSKENRITDFYNKTHIGSEEPHDFESWTPDIVFINGGTNDITANTAPSDFKKAYIDFINVVHQKNPTSTIICIHGMTTNKFENTFNEIEKEIQIAKKQNNFKIEFIKFKPISEKFYGALGHPNSKAHSRFARDLIKTVKRLLPR